MPLLAAANIRYLIGTTVILDGLSLSLEPGERVGFVGKNGGGKTTLLKILAGIYKADSGTVTLQRGSKAGYLSQDPQLNPERTLKDEAESGFEELTRLHDAISVVYHDLETEKDPAQIDRLMKKAADFEEQIAAAGGYAVDHKVEEILHGLGFTDAQFGIKVGSLSGGQKGRLALAKLLLDQPDLLMLDEPTNHLDIAGREWLEKFLAEEFKGAVLIVSHDRYVLDRVVTRIVEIEQGRLVEYPGNYSDYRSIRSTRRLTQQRNFDKQQEKFKKEEEYIRRFKAGQRARQAKGRESRLDREKRDNTLERPIEYQDFELNLPKAPRSGDLVAVVKEASKAYVNAPGTEHAGATKTLFRNLEVTVTRGQRWGIIGPNGAGKTTLVRSMLGQIPLDAGDARVGANVAIGYYSQMPDEAHPDRRVYEYLQDIIRRENPGTGFTEQQARDLAGAFLFSGSEQEKKLGVLSGGERSRARLAGLLASAKNLLILDEPTNHLDIASAERLEYALSLAEEDSGGFEGTLLLISHDRALIDATCDHLLIMDGAGNVEIFDGSYTEWHERVLQKAKEEAQRAAEAAQRANAPRRPEPKKAEPKKQEAPKPQPSNGTTKEAGAAKKKDQPKGGLSWMSDDRLEKDLAAATAKVSQIDTDLAREDVYQDGKKFSELLKARESAGAEMKKLEDEWLRRAE